MIFSLTLAVKSIICDFLFNFGLKLDLKKEIKEIIGNARQIDVNSYHDIICMLMIEFHYG